MKIEGHRKQVALFLVAVLLPVVVLVALTLRIVKQERELALKRIAVERRTMAAEIGRALAAGLDGIVKLGIRLVPGRTLYGDGICPDRFVAAGIDLPRPSG